MWVNGVIYDNGKPVEKHLSFDSIKGAARYFRLVRSAREIGNDSALVLTKPGASESFMMLHWDITPGILRSWFFSE